MVDQPELIKPGSGPTKSRESCPGALWNVRQVRRSFYTQPVVEAAVAEAAACSSQWCFSANTGAWLLPGFCCVAMVANPQPKCFNIASFSNIEIHSCAREHLESLPDDSRLAQKSFDLNGKAGLPGDDGCCNAVTCS